MAYTYKDLDGNTVNNTAGIDFLLGTRSVAQQAQSDSNAKKDIIFAKDSGTIWTNDVEYGSYLPEVADEVTALNTVGGIEKGTSAGDLKSKTLGQVIDAILFPEEEAQAGNLPTYTISNANAYYEVGETIANASATSQSGSTYKFVKNGDAYSSGNYTATAPTVTTSLSKDGTATTNFIAEFAQYTRSTEATTYTVTGPSADSLYNGTYLYKSRGGSSTVAPKATGTETKSLSATSATVYGVYKGGKNGAQTNDLWARSDGYLSSSESSGYATSLSYNVETDSETTSDHNFGDLGTVSVELPDAYANGYTVAMSSTKYNAQTKEFENDLDLTAKIQKLTVSESQKTFTDANNDNYNVISYSFDTSDINVEGKFKITLKITKK